MTQDSSSVAAATPATRSPQPDRFRQRWLPAALIGFVGYHLLWGGWLLVRSSLGWAAVGYDDDIAAFAVAVLPSLILTAVFLIALCRWTGLRPQGATPRWGTGVALALVVYLALSVVTLITAIHRGTSVDIRLLLFIFIAMCFIGFNEELLFRGLFLNGFAERLSPTLAVVLSAVAFGLFHAPNVFYGSAPGKVVPQVVATTLAGIFYGWLYVLSGRNLALMAGIHALHDFLLIAPAAVAGADQPTGELIDNLATGLKGPISGVLIVTMPLVLFLLGSQAAKGKRLWDINNEGITTAP